MDTAASSIEFPEDPVKVGIAVRIICTKYQQIRNEVNVTVADADYADLVIGSMDYLEEIIVNLLSNASKYAAWANLSTFRYRLIPIPFE